MYELRRPRYEGAHRWALADDEAQPFFRQAIELGTTFWDTANVYRRTSEEITGRAIRRYSRREDIVLATKVFGKMHDGPGGSGLSRKAIMEQIDASLARLGTNYVGLYWIHRFDPGTPVAETMEALRDMRLSGQGPLPRPIVDVKQPRPGDGRGSGCAWPPACRSPGRSPARRATATPRTAGRPPPNSTGIWWICNSSSTPASSARCAVYAPCTSTFRSPAAAFACAIALAIPSVTYVTSG